MSQQQLGLWIILGGIGLALVGVLVWAGGLAWFGKLPGDIRIQNGSTTVFIPITSMIVISIVLSLGLNVALRFLGRR